MSLPGKNEKGYLGVVGSAQGLVIYGRPQHVGELLALYAQYGVACRREAEARPGQDALRFDAGADRARVDEVLESYMGAKGS